MPTIRIISAGTSRKKKPKSLRCLRKKRYLKQKNPIPRQKKSLQSPLRFLSVP